MTPTRNRLTVATILGFLAAGLGVSACNSDGQQPASDASAIPIEQPTQGELAAADLAKRPLAPESERVDLTAEPFSNPTEVTNPLFPVSDLHSVVLSGRVDGKAFHTETTLMPETRWIEVADGEVVEAVVSQYAAFLDGRIEEVAIDYYAQADDGAVWYLGEDVHDYNEDGLIDSTEGSWLAGREGPPEMIMPADPQVGDVHRAENIPAIAFEEVAIKRINQTFDGPTGPVEGGMVARELHDDGTFSDKLFAPGYGEFFTGDGPDVEAMALAVPIDALDAPVPAELDALSEAANAAIDALLAGQWDAAAADLREINRAWHAYRAGEVPVRIAGEMDRAIEDLTSAIEAHDVGTAGNGAIDVAQSTLDLELRHLHPPEVDLARFELWARQILVHAASGDDGGVNGDIITLGWVRDRFAQMLEGPERVRIDKHIQVLRGTVVDRDPKAAEAEAQRLLETLDSVPGR